MNRPTNGILNEAIAAWWAGAQAAIYSMLTWQNIVEVWHGEQLVQIRVGQRIFYELGAR